MEYMEYIYIYGIYGIWNIWDIGNIWNILCFLSLGRVVGPVIETIFEMLPFSGN